MLQMIMIISHLVIIQIMINITFTNCTKTENDDNNIIFKFLLLSIPSSILLFSLLSLMIYTLIKTLMNNK